MLHEFLTDHRSELIDRCRSKVIARSPDLALAEPGEGIPVFLDQLIETLQLEQTTEPARSLRISGPAGGHAALSSMGDAAIVHARELLRHGYSVKEVVHDYGDLCQAITDLAVERATPIEADEFRTLNRCLDNVMAVAVAEFALQRDVASEHRHTAEINERLGVLAHELRNQLSTATLSFALIQSGKASATDAMGAVMNRSLVGLRSLIDRSLADVRIAAGLRLNPEVFPLGTFISEIVLAASLEAELRGIPLVTSEVDPLLMISGDRDLLMAAVGNLLQNAFKFTHAGSTVALHAHVVGERIHIDVEDHCGGLPEGVADAMFAPFVQVGADRSGVGLGLAISRRSVEANGGLLVVTNRPGSGCVFTIDLPAQATRPKPLPDPSAPPSVATH